MELRKYRPQDCAEMARLFYDTVHTVNAADYTEEQLDAWADGQVDLEKWNASFLEHDTLVAVEGETIVGFGDMDSTGCEIFSLRAAADRFPYSAMAEI